MPTKPMKPCAYRGCPELVPQGQRYCAAHKSEAPKEARPYAAARGYGKRWQAARLEFLEEHPLCEDCLARGRYVRATDVDHVKAHRGDPKLMWDRSNWRALCHSCHSKKTNREDRYVVYAYPNR